MDGPELPPQRRIFVDVAQNDAVSQLMDEVCAEGTSKLQLKLGNGSEHHATAQGEQHCNRLWDDPFLFDMPADSPKLEKGPRRAERPKSSRH
eukprot:1740283-Amphidinium_carterae.1